MYLRVCVAFACSLCTVCVFMCLELEHILSDCCTCAHFILDLPKPREGGEDPEGGEGESPDRPAQGDQRAAGQQPHGKGVVALSRHLAPPPPPPP